uniref:Uncharacterized protein n=1 Tax=Callorhinchus milii TaxID=7868 RepID=A0A4W3GFD0_CALMI
MHQCLTDREQRMMRDFRQREQEILKRMETNLREIQDKLASVQQELYELQTKLGKDALIFLQEEVAGNTRVSDEGFDLSVCEAELPVGIYKGLIQYTAWKHMIHGISPGECVLFSPLSRVNRFAFTCIPTRTSTPSHTHINARTLTQTPPHTFPHSHTSQANLTQTPSHTHSHIYPLQSQTHTHTTLSHVHHYADTQASHTTHTWPLTHTHPHTNTHTPTPNSQT